MMTVSVSLDDCGPLPEGEGGERSEPGEGLSVHYSAFIVYVKGSA